MIFDGLNECIDVFDIVLTIGVELYSNIVAMESSIFVTSLDGATDAEIGGEVDVVVVIFF